MKQVVKFGALAFLIACSAHTAKGAVVSSAHGKTAQRLAQGGDTALGTTKGQLKWNQVPLEQGVPTCECTQKTVVTPPLQGAQPVALGASTLVAQGVGAAAAQLTETNQYDDHRCTANSCAKKCAEGCESSAAFGVGTRKRTVCLEGDICYRNIKRADEQGAAAQNKKACEEVASITTTQLQAVEGPRPCVSVTVCPPEDLE